VAKNPLLAMAEQLNIPPHQKILFVFGHRIHLWLSSTHIFASDVEET